MGKLVVLDVAVYERLRLLKVVPRESFSDVVRRLLDRGVGGG